MEKDKISIVVPIYNVEKYLHKCVDSIINQTYTNLEIILVDDGSSDSCPAICDEYAAKDSRVKVIHQKNAGVSAARNAGLDVATGEYIAFVDSDDYVAPTMYKELISKQNAEKADLVFCRYNDENNGVKIKILENGLEFFSKFPNAKYFIARGKYIKHHECIMINPQSLSVSVCRILYRKKIFEHIRFDSSIKYLAEDQVFICSILSKYDNIKVSYVDKYLYNYVSNSNSATHTKNRPVVDNFKVVVEKLDAILCSENHVYLDGIKFNFYTDAYVRKHCFGSNENLDAIIDWKDKKCYKCSKKLNYGFINRLKAFLVYHNMAWLLRILYKFKG